MIQLTPHMRIMVAVEAVDFRKGIDGLARICRGELKSDPFSGAVFVFRNRSGKSLKVLVYDGQGFWLCQKRLSAGRYRWWPSSGVSKHCTLEVHQLQLLLSGGNPEVEAGAVWRRVRSVAE
jgi:transposase